MRRLLVMVALAALVLGIASTALAEHGTIWPTSSVRTMEHGTIWPTAY